MLVETMRSKVSEAKKNFSKHSRLAASVALASGTVACTPGGLIESTAVNIESLFSGNCSAVIGVDVRNFRDIGGVRDQFDQGIDVPLGAIANARVRLAIDNQTPIESTTNQNGIVVRRVTGPCLTGQKNIEVHLLVAAADGRRVVRDLLVRSGSSQTFPVWLVSESVGEATPTPSRTPTPTRTPEGGITIPGVTPTPAGGSSDRETSYTPYLIGGAAAVGALAAVAGALWYTLRRP